MEMAHWKIRARTYPVGKKGNHSHSKNASNQNKDVQIFGQPTKSFSRWYWSFEFSLKNDLTVRWLLLFTIWSLSQDMVFLLRNKQKGDYYRPNDMAYCVQNHVINCNFLLLIETKLNGAKIIFVRCVS